MSHSQCLCRPGTGKKHVETTHQRAQFVGRALVSHALPPPDDLLATAGAALTAARAKKARSSKRTTASARGPLPLAPRTTAPPARPSASLLAVSEAASDADAAASLRSWLASMGGAPKGSRYVRHLIAVVRKALALLEARRSDEQEGELQELLSSLAL